MEERDIENEINEQLKKQNDLLGQIVQQQYVISSFVKVDHKKLIHDGGNNAKLKTKLSKHLPLR